ncbi:MAG TPA: hypothetical protein VMZ53_23515 [Kofleriaceae bacterium]|nr:hypothetical protein [Kofleriaceae bacterium]
MQPHKESRGRTNANARNQREREAMREANRMPQPTIADIDPEDPTQRIDDAGHYSITDLDVEAQPSAEAAADIDTAVADARGEADGEDNDEEAMIGEPDETTADAYAAGVKKDSGELYGIHTPHAADNDLDKTDDQESFKDSEQGEHWLETLGKKAAEYGAAAEEELDVVDNSDHDGGHHSSEGGDRPVADKGSGGPGGL